MLCACAASAPRTPPQPEPTAAPMTRWELSSIALGQAQLELHAPQGASPGQGTLCVEEATRRCVGARVWQDRCTLSARFIMPAPARSEAREARASLTLTCAPQPGIYTGALWLEGARTTVRARRLP